MAERWNQNLAIDNDARCLRGNPPTVGCSAVWVLLLLEENDDKLDIYGLPLCGADRGLDHYRRDIPVREKSAWG